MKPLAAGAAVLAVLNACIGVPQTRPRTEFGFDALAADLRAHGANVRSGDEISQPFISIPGRFLRVNGEDIQVFEFPDAEQARAAAAQVSPDGSTIGTAKPFWAAPPHFYRRRDRVIVLYTGDATAVRAPIEAVMGPQFAGK